jgi:hypothetical protein
MANDGGVDLSELLGMPDAVGEGNVPVCASSGS